MKTEFIYSNNVKIKPLKDGLYCLAQVTLRQEGAVIMKESCVKADLKQCMKHGKVCEDASSDLGKGLVRYVSPNNNMIVLCRYHAMEIGLTKRYHIHTHGVLEAKGGNTHP